MKYIIMWVIITTTQIQKPCPKVYKPTSKEMGLKYELFDGAKGSCYTTSTSYTYKHHKRGFNSLDSAQIFYEALNDVRTWQRYGLVSTFNQEVDSISVNNKAIIKYK